MKRGVVLALVLALGLAANACRRIVDLTPLLNDAVTGDGGITDDAHDAVTAFDASVVGSD
jgi:hypothetical protein